MSDKEQLISFGFSEARVNKALKQTKNSGLTQALDYLQAHADDPEPIEGEDSAMDVEDGDEDGAPGGTAEAKVSC